MCLAQGPQQVTSVRFEPAALRSRVKQSTTEPLRSLHVLSYMAENRMEIDLNHTSFKIESKKNCHFRLENASFILF